jgi:hypothetical protein
VYYSDIETNRLKKLDKIYLDQILGVMKKVIQRRMKEDRENGEVCLICGKSMSEGHDMVEKIIRCPSWHRLII